MINSKKIYHQYLILDAVALGMNNSSFAVKIKNFLFPNHIWSFQKALPKLEYYYNCRDIRLSKLYEFYLIHSYRKKSLKLGFSIPINIFGSGLSIVHYGTIIINRATKIG